jgi:hypothetical protein
MQQGVALGRRQRQSLFRRLVYEQHRPHGRIITQLLSRIWVTMQEMRLRGGRVTGLSQRNSARCSRGIPTMAHALTTCWWPTIWSTIGRQEQRQSDLRSCRTVGRGTAPHLRGRPRQVCRHKNQHWYHVKSGQINGWIHISPQMIHRKSIDFPNSIVRYELWRGNNYFFFGGRCMTSYDIPLFR